jgi:hypothetical protein
MSAGSGASNLGYGNTSPFSNINGKFVNQDSSKHVKESLTNSKSLARDPTRMVR